MASKNVAHPREVMSRYVQLPVRRAHADWGADGSYYRSCLVEPSGAVLAWCTVGEHYSVHHDLTASQLEQARALAGKFSDREIDDHQRAIAWQRRYISAFAALGGVSTNGRVTAARRRQAKRMARKA